MFSRARIVGLVLLVLGALVMGTGAALAQNTANVTVSASVGSHCELTAGAINFGDYNPLLPGNLDMNGAFSVRCTRGTPNVTIGLNDGQHASGTTRRMVHATDATAFLTYELYQDAARGATDRWGSSGTELRPYIAASAGWTELTVYGRIGPTQDVPVGSYSDTVVATVNF